MVATRAVWRENLRGLLMVVWLVDTMDVLKAESMAFWKEQCSAELSVDTEAVQTASSLVAEWVDYSAALLAVDRAE